MKLLLPCAVLVVLSSSLDATSAVEKDGHTLVDSLKGYLQGAGFIDKRPSGHRPLAKRQTVCTSNSQCYPSGVSAVPTNLIECTQGVCACSECFEEGPSGRCVNVECEDWRYDQSERECVDNRPKQLTAFLLSLFISSTGAANFYIGRNDLAGGQLFLFLFMFVAVYSICCIPCCMACCMNKEDMKGSVFFILLMVLVLVLMVLAMLANWAWWLADLIIFATNQRDAGNGCMLQENL